MACWLVPKAVDPDESSQWTFAETSTSDRSILTLPCATEGAWSSESSMTKAKLPLSEVVLTVYINVPTKKENQRAYHRATVCPTGIASSIT